MSPKPDVPERMRQSPDPKPDTVLPQDRGDVATDESDGSDEFQGTGYEYYLVGQDGTVRPDSEDEDEDGLSSLSIQDQVQALVAQAQSVQENLSPDVQNLISESVFRQTAEESFERIQIWADTDRNPDGQTDRQIEMDGEKVETIKNIMSSFSLPSTSIPSWITQESGSI
ncbi:uncharacterized protein LOC111716085 isoform X2 [Eurytemora carolleeae]|uniref:uncharacterized protein LOC111716085 isoform X2 n=1 Tax=Eurytemora carolleeae TaxID=1294199 RepID=UPI000C7602DE|nr:uncharacterized protein LOC111716085 isoform X2 [Eurytemora carolleeae]|eukprot:XP_023347267.1 uncharacterized protein LOC111716085 isoform X2 [Eurytemora affinis]